MKVLIADDEPVIANTLTIIFNQSGFEATAAYSGDEVVEIANTFQPDILVADVLMPGMNGIEAAILVRGLLPSCRIFFLSAQPIAAELLEKARQQGHKFETGQAPPPEPVDRSFAERCSLGGFCLAGVEAVA